MAKKKSSKSSKSNYKTAKKVIKTASKLPVPVLVGIIIVVVVIGVIVYLNWDKIQQKLAPQTTARPTISREVYGGEGDLIVHYMNVGQGDGILIELPDGDEMLIDLGCKGVTVDYETVLKPYIQTYVEDNTIEHLVLTHTDEDHVKYLDEVIANFQVNNVYMPYILANPGTESTQKANAQAKIDALDQNKLNLFKDPDTIDTIVYANFFINALSEPNCNIHINMDDDNYTINNKIVGEGNSYLVSFICPTKEFYQNTNLNNAHAINAVSPVIIIEYNTRALVFTGDCNAYWSGSTLKTTEGNEWFMVQRIKALYGDSGIDCDVLKVAHHGAEEASSNEFLDAISCEYAVISCGAGNTYKHPMQEALNRMQSHNMTVYRTDLNGNIVCTVNSNGELIFNMDITNVSQNTEYIGADN